MFDQRCQATVDLELGLRLADRVAQLGISLAHANAEALHGDVGLDDPQFRPPRTNLAVTGASFMKTSQQPLVRSSRALSIWS